MSSTLRNYNLYIYGGITPYLRIGNTFPQVNVISMLSGSFKNNRLGGCGNATFVLSSKNHEYLASKPIRPDYRVAFRMQCEGESVAMLRYSGRITQAEMGYGTEKGTRTIKCEGRMTLTRGIPVIVIASAISAQDAAIMLLSFFANRTLGIQYGETSLITAGSSVTIPLLDGLDTPGDRLLKMLARLAGPDVAYGYTVGKGSGLYVIGQGMNRMYLAEMDATVVDPGFVVGVNLTQAEGKEFREGLYNGALVRCQKSLGGGQLTMFYPPPSSGDGMKPWRIANLTVPEAVEPAIGWDYATAWVDAHSFRDGEYNQSIKFHAADFGRQIWPDEVIKNKLRIYMQEPDTDHPEGRVPIDAVVNSYTVKIGGDGSVSTDFQLGTPPIDLGEEWKKVYQEVQLAEIREFWSTAELAAGDSDVMRTWRRAAARQWWIRNFWGANLNSIESVLSQADYLALIATPVAGVYYEWEYDPESQAVVSALEAGLDSALVASIRIPTGRRATSCAVYAKGAQRTFKPTSYAAWRAVGSGNFEWMWLTSVVYPQPTGSDPADYWAKLWLQQEFDATVEAQPVTLEIERPRMNFGGAETFDLTSFLASDEWTDFGSAYDAPNSRYYAVRLIRGHQATGNGIVYVLPGWYEYDAGIEGFKFHTDYFITPPGLDSFSVGDDDSDSALSDYSFLRIVLELPNPDNNFGAFYVTISKRDTGEVLYTGGGGVEPFLPGGLWTPAGTYWAVAQWKDYPTSFRTPIFESSRRPHGLRKVIVPEAGGFTVLATRDDSTWTQGLSGTLMALHGADTNESGDYGIRIGVHINRMQALKAWGLAFHLEDDQWPDP